MTVDKFGRNLTHPYHLNRKIVTKDVINKQDIPKAIFGYTQILIVIEKEGNTKRFNGRENYIFPLHLGTVENIKVSSKNSVAFKINNGVTHLDEQEIINKRLGYGDRINFSSSDRKFYVELLIKYPIVFSS